MYGRWSNHKWCLNNHRHSNQHLQSAWNKYGENNFSFNLVEKCDIENIDKLEQLYIEYYDTTNDQNGYNLDSGGNLNKTHSPKTIAKMKISAKGIFPSEETKLKISKNRKGKNTGSNHFMYGKHLPDSTKAKLSKALTGMFAGDKHYNAKKVICLTTNEVFTTILEAATYYDTHDANILKCCKHQRKSAGKTKDGTPLQWEYYCEEQIYESREYLCDTNAKPIIQYNLGNKYIATYKSAREAEKATGIGYKMISRVCNGGRPHTHGYIFKFDQF